MICTECFRDDGIEAPYFGFGKKRTAMAIQVAVQWKCPDCLTIAEREATQSDAFSESGNKGTTCSEMVADLPASAEPT